MHWLSLLQVYCVGISSLQLFVQRNWLGCLEDEKTKDFDKIILDEESTRELVLDGECFFPTVRSLPLLTLAKTILCDLKDSLHFKVCSCCTTIYN